MAELVARIREASYLAVDDPLPLVGMLLVRFRRAWAGVGPAFLRITWGARPLGENRQAARRR